MYVFTSLCLRICHKAHKSNFDKTVTEKNYLNAFCTYTYKNLWFKSVHFNMCSTNRSQFFQFTVHVR